MGTRLSNGIEENVDPGGGTVFPPHSEDGIGLGGPALAVDGGGLDVLGQLVGGEPFGDFRWTASSRGAAVGSSLETCGSATRRTIVCFAETTASLLRAGLEAVGLPGREPCLEGTVKLPRRSQRHQSARALSRSRYHASTCAGRNARATLRTRQVSGRDGDHPPTAAWCQNLRAGVSG